MKICLHQFLGDCPNCTKDFDESHHPNNMDCKNFYPISILIMEVKDESTPQTSKVLQAQEERVL